MNICPFSSAGRASVLHAECRRFDPVRGHTMEVNMEIEESDVVWPRSACKSCESDFKSTHICIAPKMTVSKIKDNIAYCVWWDGNSYRQDSFRLCTLSVLAKKEDK